MYSCSPKYFSWGFVSRLRVNSNTATKFLFLKGKLIYKIHDSGSENWSSQWNKNQRRLSRRMMIERASAKEQLVKICSWRFLKVQDQKITILNSHFVIPQMCAIPAGTASVFCCRLIVYLSGHFLGLFSLSGILGRSWSHIYFI